MRKQARTRLRRTSRQLRRQSLTQMRQTATLSQRLAGAPISSQSSQTMGKPQRMPR